MGEFGTNQLGEDFDVADFDQVAESVLQTARRFWARNV
jgi:hypothetical protein